MTQNGFKQIVRQLPPQSRNVPKDVIQNVLAENSSMSDEETIRLATAIVDTLNADEYSIVSNRILALDRG